MRKLFFFPLLLLILGCQRVSDDPLKKIVLLTPSGDSIETSLAISLEDQTKGLSGIRNNEFKDNQGMLFFYSEDSVKAFWMPDTYFDLDIFFLDKELTIIDVARKVPHYIGRHNPEAIPKVRPVWARHALELKSNSEISKRLKVGDKLKWKSELSLEETESKIKNQGL